VVCFVVNTKKKKKINCAWDNLIFEKLLWNLVMKKPKKINLSVEFILLIISHYRTRAFQNSEKNETNYKNNKFSQYWLKTLQMSYRKNAIPNSFCPNQTWCLVCMRWKRCFNIPKIYFANNMSGCEIHCPF
jgi:hypothetical protein